MTTLVRSTPNHGRLQQAQVGAADVVATLSAAHSAWGWIGGLEGVRNILANIRNPLGQKALADFGIHLRLRPATYNIITSDGVKILHDPECQNSFSGNPITQLLGFTICALSHELEANRAISLFMDFLAPVLFSDTVGKTAGIREALYTQLLDRRTRILNEGAARGLTQSFNEAIQQLNLPPHPETVPHLRATGIDMADYMFVGGLLRWLGKGEQRSYLTRSAFTAQVAACLKDIGYSIGPIVFWDGVGSPPLTWKGVILVVGGSLETDIYREEENVGSMEICLPPVHHYRQKTIGSLLFNLLGSLLDMWPETFQTDFNTVDAKLRKHLRFTWKSVEDSARVHAVASWSKSQAETTPISRSLAAIHFGTSANPLAMCYGEIANEKFLTAARRKYDDESPVPWEVTRFRGFTVAILISIASMLGGPAFESLYHCTSIDLRYDRDKLSRQLDEALEHGFSFTQAIKFVSAFHCGRHPLVKDGDRGDQIGCQNGAYAVLPTLLFKMAPVEEALTIREVAWFSRA